LGQIFEFLAFLNLWGAGLQNLYISDHAHLKARYVAKYHGATPTTKVIEVIGVQFAEI